MTDICKATSENMFKQEFNEIYFMQVKTGETDKLSRITMSFIEGEIKI